ncbi:hypothetical protein [Methanobrevibacter oralis]|mgnify:CR=1 FL=1|uniref:Uncharacterized protein n=1 Tax=Methanobrevibacter oralis TaxID=66851 RepID=A0A166A9L1_METOA|nr:hypothetical protein [Methanobrevibacter oralis]KZX11752.1 hypothetical protein MBORA_14560 [Methanobrevibacter oralis]
MGLTCNISYEKIAEILYLTQGTIIRRDTLYKFFNEKVDDFIEKIENKVQEEFENSNIELSDTLSYDEQYFTC